MRSLLFVTAAALVTCSPVNAQVVSCDHSKKISDLCKIYDLNKDKLLDAAEQAIIADDLRIAAQRPALPQPPKPEPDPGPNTQITRSAVLVRDAYGANPFLLGDQKTSVKGALFSYTRDGMLDRKTWAAKGAVMFAQTTNVPLPEFDRLAEPHITRYAFLGGVEFDRKESNFSPKSKGSTAIRAGWEVAVSKGGEFFRHYLKTDAVYVTDYDGKASIYGFEAMWMPVARTLPIAKNFSVFERLSAWANFSPTLNVDYFNVDQNGVFTNLPIGQSFLWIGPKLEASLFFDDGPLKPFSLSVKYFYLYNVLSAPFDATVNYRQFSANYVILDASPAGVVSLEARYTQGNTPRTLQNQNEFYAGLSVKLGELFK